MDGTKSINDLCAAHQLDYKQLAQRAGLGVARTGGVGEHTSGDLFLAFSTGNRGLAAEGAAAEGVAAVRMLGDGLITPLFDAVVEATEEAILNALLAAETTTGRDGTTAHRLDHDLLRRAVAALTPDPARIRRELG